MLLLVAACFAVYFISLQFGLTELDDSIFIRDFHTYNEDLANLFHAFHRGLFDAAKDPYYRPLFMDSIILNYQLSDHGLNVMSFHLVNLFMHAGTVLLLYRLFLRLSVPGIHAFLLSLIFAVHPVLSMAVAWIPGRNDMMLAIFILGFLLQSISYTETGRLRPLLGSSVCLLLAFFTKETAVFAAPAAFVIQVFLLRRNWKEKNLLVQYGLWLVCFAVWYLARASSAPQTHITTAQVIAELGGRLPVIVQYIGKIFLPFNLSVFPTQDDTGYIWGLIACILLAAAFFFSPKKNWRIAGSGFALFLLFLLPALLVPSQLNGQTFEHRLYLPVMGLLLVLSQTVLFRNALTDKQLVYATAGLCLVLSVLNIRHEKSFENTLNFWTQAQETSPHSAYATMMLAARLDKDQFNESCALFRRAYELNPREKYLNFYMGEMLQKKDSVLASEPYLLAEKNGSGYYQCDFYLARVAMEKKDLNGAIAYLLAYLEKDPANAMAHNNLLLLYADTHQQDKAKAHVQQMQAMGLAVPRELLQKIGR